jgi:hypothetical protein
MAIALKEDRPVRGVVAYAERPDGKLIPFTPYPTPLHDGSGRLIGGINMLVDITEQKKREEQIEFVMRELSHRSKNLLAIVVAIANRTIRSCSDIQEFAPKFMKRIEAMARAHDLLVQNSWAGADIRDVVRSLADSWRSMGRNARASKAIVSCWHPALLRTSVSPSMSLRRTR